MTIVHLDTGDESSNESGGGTQPSDEAVILERLRLRAATALEAAYRFLERQDDDWARLRAAVLCQACPATDLTERLAASQRPDGSLPPLTLVAGGAAGFPKRPTEGLEPGDEALVGTVEALWMAADARVLHADWVEPAVRFLESRQSGSGAFVGPAALDRAEAPASESPSASETLSAAELEAGIFWTGTVAGILGRIPAARPGPLEAAGSWLAERFAPDAVEASYSVLAATASFFTNVAHDRSDEILQWCGRALEKGFRSRQLDAVLTLRVLLTCDAQAMPGATFDVVELLERIFEEQAGDGGFAELSLGGPATRTTQTFDAMLAIVRLCAALGD